MKAFYCVGLSGFQVVKAIFSQDVDSVEYAEKLFIAMYGVTSVITCKEATIADLYFYARHLETRVIEARREGATEMMNEWMRHNPPKVPSKVKRKYTRRKK